MKKILFLILPAFVLLFQATQANIMLDSLWRFKFDSTIVMDAKFTPNGQYIAVAHGFYEGPWTHIGVVIKPWLINRATGQKVREFTGLNSNSVESVDISPDGTLLAAGGSTNDSIASVCIWNISTGILQRTLLSNDSILRKKYDRVSRVAFSKDGRYLFICIDSLGERHELNPNHTVHVFTPILLVVINTQTWQTQRYKQNYGASTLITLPNNRFYAFNGGVNAFLVNIDTDSLVHLFPYRITGIDAIDLSPDSSKIAVSDDNRIYFYNLNSFALLDSITTDFYNVGQTKFFPNSRYLYYDNSSGYSYRTHIVDINTKEILWTDSTTGFVDISKDSKYLLDINSYDYKPEQYIQLDSIIYTQTKVEDPDEPHQGINTIYPNPTDGSINIKVNEANVGVLKFEIFDSNGNKVSVNQSDIHIESDNTFHYNAHSLGSGVYYFRIISPYNIQTYKFINIHPTGN